jgi:hypothetical protein
MPPPPPPPTVAQTSTFSEYYNDSSKDEHNLLYTNVMAVFRSGAAGQTPAQIRELVTNNPRDSSLGYVTLITSTANPAHQGMLYGIHSLAKFETRLGQPPTQWDGRIFGSIHDTVGHQIPTTIELPTDAFSRHAGGTQYRVGIPQLMNASFATDNDLQLLGAFGNMDAATELIESRNMVPVPHRYMRHFIGGPLTPRQAWETVGGAIAINNDQAACEPLLNFLRLACTRNAAGDMTGPVIRPGLQVPLADTILTRHRTELIEFKLPGLNRTPILAAGQAIAQSVGELVAESRASRQDVLNRHTLSATKTITDYYGASTASLLRLCQVPGTEYLPPIYQKLADYGRKKERITMQREIDDTLNSLGMTGLQLVVTADLATKLTSLMWLAHPEDLAQGIHPFCVGETNPTAIAKLQALARTYDLISNDGASPNLADAQSLVGNTKASIPISLISLDAQNQLFLVLLKVFLGPGHVVTVAWNDHMMETKSNLLKLQLYTPRTPNHQLLLPALVQRWAQLRFSYWVAQQSNSMNDIPAPELGNLWMQIELKGEWESPLPIAYLTDLPTIGDTGRRDSPGNQTPATPRPAPRAPTGGAPPTAPPAQPQQESERCTPYNETFAPYRATGTRVRDVIKTAKDNGHSLPKADAGSDMCISFHVKGICSTTCGRRADHKSHNAAETDRLKDWCVVAFPGVV